MSFYGKSFVILEVLLPDNVESLSRFYRSSLVCNIVKMLFVISMHWIVSLRMFSLSLSIN